MAQPGEAAADLLRTLARPPKYSGPGAGRPVAVNPMHQLAFAGSLESPLFLPLLSVRGARTAVTSPRRYAQAAHPAPPRTG
jgi:hypothetical protein